MVRRTLLDFFAGSGTLGEAAALENRNAVLVDESPDAMRVMKRRLSKYDLKVARENA